LFKKLEGELAFASIGPKAAALFLRHAIKTQGRQSCLARLLQTAREIRQILAAMNHPDAPSVRFCIRLARLLKLACAMAIPVGSKARRELTHRLLAVLDRIGAQPLSDRKAETIRKRLIPGAREHSEGFTCINVDGPATNNHAERALHPLVIFRKVCMGSRSEQGSRNIGIFNRLTQTAKLQNCFILDPIPRTPDRHHRKSPWPAFHQFFIFGVSPRNLTKMPNEEE
jgi:hypothetical protein